MEFSYRVSEKDYVRAWKMAALSRRGPVIKTVLFWAFVIICLVLLFAIIEKNNNRHVEARQDQSETEQTELAVAPSTVSSSFENIAKNVAPLALVAGIWVFLIFYWTPLRVRRRYRKDTNCHGQVTIALDAHSVDIRSSVGISFQSGWNAFTDWSEKQNIVLFRQPSGTFHIVNIAELSEVERDELRGILSAALPRKK